MLMLVPADFRRGECTHYDRIVAMANGSPESLREQNRHYDRTATKAG